MTVGVSFVEERERVIHEQQEAMRELSTPVLQLRDRLLILPIIGVLDSARARQLTEQLLGAIRDNRATVVVIDITGVATIDRTVANHLVQTVEASRLMGARTILTGLSSEIAQTLVDLGVDLGMMKTVGDLQGGIEEAERLAGYRGADHERRRPATPRPEPAAPMSVAILRQGDYLIASDPVGPLRQRGGRRSATSSPSWSGRHRSRGIVIDVAALDVIDSFVARALRSIVLTAQPARRRHRHRRHPARRGDRDGAVPPEPGAAAGGARPRRGEGAARSHDRGDAGGWRMRSAWPSPAMPIS